jgi:hypothetical protein
MRHILELPGETGVLTSAFRAVKEKQGIPPNQEIQVVEQYTKHFVAPASPCTCKHSQRFERFSLVDPTIRTVVGSTTDTSR